MKKFLWIVAIVVLAFVGLFIAAAYEEHQMRDQRQTQISDMRAEHSSYSQKCLRSYEVSARRNVLDWSGQGPFGTSTGSKFIGNADLGSARVEVTCYFSSSGDVINIQAR